MNKKHLYHTARIWLTTDVAAAKQRAKEAYEQTRAAYLAAIQPPAPQTPTPTPTPTQAAAPTNEEWKQADKALSDMILTLFGFKTVQECASRSRNAMKKDEIIKIIQENEVLKKKVPGAKKLKKQEICEQLFASN